MEWTLIKGLAIALSVLVACLYLFGIFIIKLFDNYDDE